MTGGVIIAPASCRANPDGLGAQAKLTFIRASIRASESRHHLGSRTPDAGSTHMTEGRRIVPGMQLADLSPDQRKLISIVSDENPRIRSARSGLARGAMIGGVPPALAGAAWGARIGASLGPAGMLGGAAAGAAIAAAVPLAVGAAVGGAVRAIRPREYPRILKH